MKTTTMKTTTSTTKPQRGSNNWFFRLCFSGLFLVLGMDLLNIDVFGRDLGKKKNPKEPERQSPFITTKAAFTTTKKTIVAKEVERIPIFYNAFTAKPENVSNVQALIREQLSFMIPEWHGPVYLTTIGQTLDNITTSTSTNSSIDNNRAREDVITRQHLAQGDEAATLQALWEYCTAHTNSRVIYLHSKGSFHPSPANTQLRLFLTRGALSPECARSTAWSSSSSSDDDDDDDDTACNVCSSRFSPLPHPHTPGNMWLARCDYVVKLIEPRLFTVLMDAMHAKLSSSSSSEQRSWLSKAQQQQLWIKAYTTGTKRFAQEHWIHSHPTVRPCDLYPHQDFVWGYKNVPNYDNFTAQIAMGPRFATLEQYRRGDVRKIFPGLFVPERLYEYQFLYNQEPPDSWWGWDLFANTDNNNNNNTETHH